MIKSDLEISQYLDKDSDEVWKLHLHIVQNHKGFLSNLDFYEDVKNIKKFYHSFFLLKKEDKVIGMVGLKDNGHKEFEIKRLQVHSDFQGQGLGKILFNKILDCALQNNAKRLILDFDNNNEYLYGFYKSFGFEKFNEGKDFFGPDNEEFDMIYMEKTNL